MRLTRAVIALLVIAAASTLAVFSRWPPSEPSPTPAARAAPTPPPFDAGDLEPPPPDLLRVSFDEVPVTDDEVRAWFDAHADAFDGRSFERSRRSVEKLVRIRKLRAAYGLDVDGTEAATPRPDPTR
jgi:hypothetical protein